MKRSISGFSVVMVGLLAAPLLYAQTPARPSPAPAAKATSLDELLEKVRSRWRTEGVENKRREQEFATNRDKQAALLKKARAELAAVERRGQELERGFEANETQITQLEETLRVRLGTMGEMFGVVRQVAGEMRGQLENSMISSQFPGREQGLQQLADSKALPSIEELERLWFLMQQEMTEAGKVVRFKATVVGAKGTEGEKQVVRVGPFNAIAGGKFLRWLPEVGKLAELGRQPPSKYLDAAADLESAQKGIVKGPLDISRGQLLAMLIQTPDFWEHISFGGVIGYITIVLGVIAFIGSLVRLVQLSRTSSLVRRQQNNISTPQKNNPLGRVLAVYDTSRGLDTETLERKLDEAVVTEASQLERFLWAIKLTSVVAPLLGLLGTVTGMIKTFQVITLFGAGDPKLMASGISEALVTTEIGLMVAIPLTLLHGWLVSSSRSIVEVVTEQSAGLLATRAEQEARGAAAS